MTTTAEIRLGLRRLSGTIPTQFGNLRRLGIMVVSSDLSGTLPSEIGMMTDLGECDAFSHARPKFERAQTFVDRAA